MIKKLLVVALVAACFVGLGRTASAARNETKEDKVRICHRTQSNPNSNNPYNNIEVNQSAVDGEGSGNADHYGNHQGPLITSVEQYQFFKDNKIEWGDIIPPVPGFHDGLNWTTEGETIWNNECNVPETPDTDPTPNLDYVVDCEANEVKVTLLNSGNGAGTITVNGEDVPVGAYSVETKTYPSNTTVVVEIDGQVVFNEVVTCGGRGGEEDPETPTTAVSTPQVDAPTGGVGAGAGQTAVVAAMIASVISLAYGVIRLRKFGL